jgi:hypothetical protein
LRRTAFNASAVETNKTCEAAAVGNIFVGLWRLPCRVRRACLPRKNVWLGRTRTGKLEELWERLCVRAILMFDPTSLTGWSCYYRFVSFCFGFWFLAVGF